MDNASKALIMAGAILISLALVGLGVYIFSISSDLQDNAGQTMDAMSAQTTNKQLSSYAGTRVRGSNVKALADTVRVLNTQDVFPIDIDFVEDASKCTNATGATWNGTSTIQESAYFEVVMEDAEGDDGYLDTIYVRAY